MHKKPIPVPTCLFTCFAFAMLLATSKPSPADDEVDYGSLRTDLRTFLFNRDKQDQAPDSIATTQALMLRYSSPLFNDVVGLDASYFGNAKLSAKDGEGGTGLLKDKDDGSQGSYSKLAEIYARFRFSRNFGIDLGRMELNTPLLNDPDIRATPSTTQAGYFKFDNGKTGGYGLVTDKGSARTDSDFGSYIDSKGNDFTVYVAGITHKFETGFYIHGSAGHADDVMNQAYLNAGRLLNLESGYGLLLDGHFYFGEADGNGSLNGIGPNYDSDIANIAAQLVMGNTKWAVSYQKVSGDTYLVSWDGGNRDNNTYKTWHSVQRSDFNRAGEQSWMIRFDYDFKDRVDGLKLLARYVSGDEIDRSDGGEGKEWERNIDFTYVPPALKNLSIRWRYSVVRSTETFDSDEHRFIVNYRFDSF